MSSSVVTTKSADIINPNKSNTESASVIMNFQNANNAKSDNTIDITITTTDESTSLLPPQTQHTHIAPKAQVVPLVYIQAPKLNLPYATGNKTSTSNVIVNTVSPLQLSNVNDKAQSIPIPASKVHNPGVVFGNSVKTQQLLIQKSSGNLQTVPVVPVSVSSSYGSKITGAYLTMIKPVPKNSDTSNLIGSRVQVAGLNKVKPSDGLHIINNATIASASICTQTKQYVIAPMPKITSNRLPVTATTNSVQSKIAIMPVTIPKPTNTSCVKHKVFNFKITDGQLQNKDSSIITVMCDSSKQEEKQNDNSVDEQDLQNSREFKCDEVIDLNSPDKNEANMDKTYELSIIEDSGSPKNDGSFTISIPDDTDKKGIEKKKEVPKFQKHGISILKKSFNYSEQHRTEKPSSLIISPIPNSITTISDANTKEVKITTNLDFEEEPVIIAETKPPQKTERRRKSNFSYRKDYDDVEVTSGWSCKKPHLEQPDNADVTLTTLEETDTKDVDKNVKNTIDDAVEIEVIKENSDINMNNDDQDVMKILKWDDGIGTLPGSTLKFQMNEFGLLEYLTENEYKNVLQNKAANAKQKETKAIKDEYQEEVRCVSCGCYGMLSDFVNPKYCSFDCQESANKVAKEKESKLKKKKKKFLKKTADVFADTEREQTPSDDENTSNENSQDKFNYPWTCTKKGFSWAKYLDHIKAKSAPVKLFKDPFPYNRNGFRPGMKLEGVDPQHPAYFCILTVAEVIGYRVRMHFDGFPENYDFWVNADCMDIFPIGWCEKHGHALRPPPGYPLEDFNWTTYLKQTKSTAAPKHLFANRAGNAICPNGFRVGMKLEAVDRKNTTLVCVASVADMMDNRILVHFDSWDNIYDYWADPTSPYIHPVGWCDQYGHNLTPPNGYPNPETFTWEKYLKETKAVAAPVRAFKQRPACGFKRGMRLECVDRRVPQLIRVATVDDVRDHQLRISFDGWPDRYSYWVDDDSNDIHPVGWCQKTGHPIEPPLTPDDVYDFPECVTVGCRGQGHIKGPKFSSHSNQRHCPYADENIDQDRVLPDRLLSPDQHPEAVVPVSREPPKEKTTKARLGRPPKLQRVEPMKMEWNDISQDKKPKKKYKNTFKSELHEYRKKDILTNGFTMSVAERRAWTKHSKYLSEFIKSDIDPREWSEEDVVEFVTSLPNCKEHGALFSEHSIDGESFLLLTQQDLVDILKIKLGPAIKLYNSIVLLRKNVNQVFA